MRSRLIMVATFELRNNEALSRVKTDVHNMSLSVCLGTQGNGVITLLLYSFRFHQPVCYFVNINKVTFASNKSNVTQHSRVSCISSSLFTISKRLFVTEKIALRTKPV